MAVVGHWRGFGHGRQKRFGVRRPPVTARDSACCGELGAERTCAAQRPSCDRPRAALLLKQTDRAAAAICATWDAMRRALPYHRRCAAGRCSWSSGSTRPEAGDGPRRPERAAHGVRPRAGAAAAAPARRRRWPRCTSSRATLLDGGKTAFEKRMRRAARAIPWWSTSGRRGAGRAAPSSRSSSRSPPSAASEIAFVGVDARRQAPGRRAASWTELPAPVPLLRGPGRGHRPLAEGARQAFPMTMFIDAREDRRSSSRASTARRADLSADIDRYLGDVSELRSTR